MWERILIRCSMTKESLMQSRRSFLASLGASLLASGLSPRISKAGISGCPAPKRLFLFFSPNGTIPQTLWPSGGEKDFVFTPGSVWEPLEPIRQKLTLLKGLDYFGADNHEPGMLAMLTANGGANSETGGLSLDQIIANHIGTESRFKSLELGVQTSPWGGNQQTRMSYVGPGVFATPDDNPLSVYNRMFADQLTGEEALKVIQSRRKSILDLARGEVLDLKSRVSGAAKTRLETHLDALFQVEQSLFSTIQCAPTQKPQLAEAVWSNEAFPQVGALQMDLGITALACGMTNVVSLQWSHTVGPTVFSWLGINEGHHSLSHTADSVQAGIDHWVKVERWYSDRFVELVNKLDELPDPDGDGSMLDTTLVVWCKELGDGRMHVCLDVPWVIAGATSCFEHERFLQLGGIPHNSLLVSLSNSFGIPLSTFGDPGGGSGPLEALS